MAAAKPETPAASPAAAKEAPVPVPVANPGAGGGLKAWLPVAAALLLAPAATWGTVEFVLLPRLQKKIAASPITVEAPPPEPAGGGKSGGGKASGKEGGGSTPAAYEFQNVVVNLAGTMGTRYLKTSFMVTAANGMDIKALFDGAKPRLTDVTLNVLSSLSLADLEEPGAKNIIREKLVGAYNQALGKKVADQVYFSDFVIQ